MREKEKRERRDTQIIFRPIGKTTVECFRSFTSIATSYQGET